MTTSIEMFEFNVEKKANHRAPIVRIKELLPIEGADRIVEPVVAGYEEFSFVSGKDSFKVGDLAVFIQPDSIVPQTEPFRFVYQEWIDKMVSNVNDVVVSDLTVPASQRRITVRRFKKVWSEGLLMPLSDFNIFSTDGKLDSLVGQDVSEALGITHYDADTAITGKPEAPDEEFVPRRKKRRPSTLKGWFFYLLHKLHVLRNEKFLRGPQIDIPVYDVENFKNYSRTFLDGEDVVVTEKIHGSSARFVCFDGVMYAGSRKQWVTPTGSSYPAQALSKNPWIETWCRRFEGYTLYGEVTPRQKGFDYGGEVKFWLFDIRSPEGAWIDSNSILYVTLPDEADMVPVLYRGGYEKAFIDLLVDGSTTVKGASHIREGIVIKLAVNEYRRGVGRAQLKIVSNAFLEKDSKLTKG